jgi:hypothetical protein
MEEYTFKNYVPYGNEWVKEMMKLKKADIIEMFKNKCSENKALIIKLERSMATKQPTENAKCAIFNVKVRYLLIEWLNGNPIIDGCKHFKTKGECLEYYNKLPKIGSVEYTICETVNVP